MTFSKELYKVSFKGINCQGDMALWKKPAYNDYATAVLLSLYGSENQIRGIFSALATNKEIKLTDEKEHFELTRGYEGHLRFKSFRIGYGKYHCLIWNEELAAQSIIAFKQEQEAWERFLKKKRIPFLKEWMPSLVKILEKESLVEVLDGIGLKAWHWKASDDEVCDLLVREIYR